MQEINSIEYLIKHYLGNRLTLCGLNLLVQKMQLDTTNVSVLQVNKFLTTLGASLSPIQTRDKPCKFKLVHKTNIGHLLLNQNKKNPKN